MFASVHVSVFDMSLSSSDAEKNPVFSWHPLELLVDLLWLFIDMVDKLV